MGSRVDKPGKVPKKSEKHGNMLEKKLLERLQSFRKERTLHVLHYFDACRLA